MKTSTFPALRAKPELREAAERALRPNETLSNLMEASLESYIAHRAAEDDFIARGLRSAQKAKEANRYISAEAVFVKLDKKLIDAKQPATAGKTTKRAASGA
ncbi:MAG: YlcI/YnfO family protein [Polaromonas sp.]|uniref:YlcI/YnfO family protein n=1 Tax=Polaromonas sp. TaxID=1869339 RepID=UPI002736E47A|nr:YlcI/YnfO family protein [Polaromonas sp.]MDP2818596.1 YlcI/YnfO family protein [Polaromonas sp.]